jgi:hypothetical protein
VQALYEQGESLPSGTYSVQFPFPETPEEPIPPVTVLYANYPNPFNPSTTLSFDLAVAGRTELRIFNLRGQLVKTLCNHELTAGKHRYVWDGRDSSNRSVASGVYFYRLDSPQYRKTRKMLLVK